MYTVTLINIKIRELRFYILGHAPFKPKKNTAQVLLYKCYRLTEPRQKPHAKLVAVSFHDVLL